MSARLSEIIQRTRQHHAVEHATIHLLTARFPQQRFSAVSDPLGFTIYGDVDEQALRRSVGDALLRLQAGECGLAIHPHCGTNLATTGLLVTLAAAAALSRRGTLIERLTLAFVMVLPALVAGEPLGIRLQNYTTASDVGDRWLADIRPLRLGRLRVHRVLFD